MDAALSTLAVFFAVVWLTGCALCVVAGIDRPDMRPKYWPWAIPVWPLLIAIDWNTQRRERARLDRLKREVWKR